MPAKSSKSWQVVRLSMVLCWVLWLITFFISVTILQAVFQIHVVAQVTRNIEKGFSSFEKDFVYAAPLETLSTGDQSKIDEMLLRYYLEMRYTRIPDEEEMKRRWGPGGLVAYLSTSDVYMKARLDVERVEADPARVVDIRSITPTGGSTYQVILDLHEFDGVSQWVKQTRSLFVTIAHDASRVILTRNFSNPYGFYIAGLDDRRSSN